LNRKINILKKLDAALGPALVRLVRFLIPLRKSAPGRISSILVIRPGGIGDAVLLLPAINALKRHYPHSEITLLCEKRNEEIFHLCKAIDKILLYEKPAHLFSAIFGGCDVVIDTEQWYRLSAVIACLTRAPFRIGFATNERRLLFSRNVAYDQDKYEMESFLDLVESLIEKKPRFAKPFLAVPGAEAQKAETLLQALVGRKKVALFPGGSIPEKKWPPEKFHSLAVLLARKGYALVAIGGMDDYTDCCNLTEDIRESVNVCGKLTLAGTAAVLSRVSLLITGDSGIMHLAYALGTPTLSLFGPGNEKKWAPPGNSHAVIRKGIDCSPCTKFGYVPRCKKNRECMRLIEVDEVYNKAVELMER